MISGTRNRSKINNNVNKSMQIRCSKKGCKNHENVPKRSQNGGNNRENINKIEGSKNVAFSEPSGRSQLISLVRQRRVPATAFVICAFLCWCCFFCVDRGLLQMIAFCSLQVLDRSFYHASFLRLFFACFCIHLHVLDVFR